MRCLEKVVMRVLKGLMKCNRIGEVGQYNRRVQC